MDAGPSSPLLNQTEILLAADDFIATAHQLSATYELIVSALELVEAYEGIGGYGLPVSYGPPVLDGREFSRTRGTVDGRELDRTMMIVQQHILDQLFHANLWGVNGVPKVGSSDMIDWPYKPIVKECRDLFRGRKWWAARYIPGIVDPPSDPSVTHTELVKASYPIHWGRPIAFTTLKRAAYPIGGLYLAPGGVAEVTVPQELVNHGNYSIQVGSMMVTCEHQSRGWARQGRMTTNFPVDDTTVYIANPFGGELYLRSPYGSDIGPVNVQVTGDVVVGASFFYSSLRNTTEEEWNHLRETATAPWAHVVTNPYLTNWGSEQLKKQSYTYMLNRAKEYTELYNAISRVHGIPPENRNTWVLFETWNAPRCGRAKVGTMGYPQSNDAVKGTVNGPEFPEFDKTHPVKGGGFCCGITPVPFAHDPKAETLHPRQTSFHELGHTAMHRFYHYNGGQKEANVHIPLMVARLALHRQDDISEVDPTGLDTAFMFSCCKVSNPYTWAPRYTIDRSAIEWMTRDNFRNGLPTDSEETKYQHRGHAKFADIARLLGGSMEYMDAFMFDEHARWEAEGLGIGKEDIGNNYWNKVSNTTFFPGELADHTYESRTLRFSMKAGQDLTPLLHFWGVHHSNYTLLKELHVARGLHPSQEQMDLILKYKSLIPKDATALEALRHEIWVPDITRKCTHGCSELVDRVAVWNQTMVDQAESVVDDILQMFWPSIFDRKLQSGGSYLRKPSALATPISRIGNRILEVSSTLSENRAKWTSEGALDYTFTFERDCLCEEEFLGPFKVTVRDNSIVKAEYTGVGSEEKDSELISLSDMTTITGLFDYIGNAPPEDTVNVRYDSKTGYPIEIDVMRNDDDDDNTDELDDIDWMTIYVSSVVFGVEDEE
jgi:hypothetical protein